MNTKQACKMLRKIQRDLSPDYTTPSNPSTFLIIELSDLGGDMKLSTAIIDPDITNEGNAEVYLALEPRQRALIDLSYIVERIIPAIVAVATHAPSDKSLQDFVGNDLPLKCKILCDLTCKAAIEGLTE